MKVLQINTVYKYESTGRIAYEIKMVSEANGIEAYVAYGYKAVAHNDARTYCMQGKWRRKWNILKTRIWGKHGFYNKVETCRLIKYIDSIQPDIIHLHNIHNHYVNVEMLFRYIKEKDIPVVWTLHDCWTFTGWCPHFDFIKCDKWKLECHHCPLLREYPVTWFFDRSKELYNQKKACFCGVTNMTIVPVSEWLREKVSESFLKTYPQKMIYNGVDIRCFKPSKNVEVIRDKYNIPHKKILLGVASSWTVKKGLNDYAALSAKLSSDYQIVLVGISEDKAKTLPSKIKCIGRTQSVQELASFYTLADIVLNLSYQETFGLTTVEGFACGTPSVVYNRTASPELIPPECGAIVEAGDIDALIEAVERIASKGKDFYSLHCVNRVKAMFDKEKQYQKYIDLYREILSKKENHA